MRKAIKKFFGVYRPSAHDNIPDSPGIDWVIYKISSRRSKEILPIVIDVIPDAYGDGKDIRIRARGGDIECQKCGKFTPGEAMAHWTLCIKCEEGA